MCVCIFIGLEHQLEEQKKQQSWLSQSQALGSLLAPSSSPPAKRASKRPRLQRPASTTLLGSTLGQPVTFQPPQFTVLSPITLPSVGQPFAVAGLAQPSSAVTLHALPVGSQVGIHCDDHVNPLIVADTDINNWELSFLHVNATTV